MKKPIRQTTTTVTPKANSTVEIWHSQSVKQSANYQSADVTYGIKIVCADDPKTVKRETQRAEQYVESHLLPKMELHSQLLKKL